MRVVTRLAILAIRCSLGGRLLQRVVPSSNVLVHLTVIRLDRSVQDGHERRCACDRAVATFVAQFRRVQHDVGDIFGFRAYLRAQVLAFLVHVLELAESLDSVDVVLEVGDHRLRTMEQHMLGNDQRLRTDIISEPK